MSKISLPIAELKPALIGLGKVINKRCTLPVLTHIKIERTKDGWVALTGTDLDSFVTVRLEQPSDGEPLSLLVPYDELLKTTKNCQKTDTVAIRTGENLSELSVTVEYPVGQQTAEAKMTSLPVVEFPEIPRIKGEPVPVNDAVRQSIHEAFDCASTDETRLILNSAFIDVSKDEGHYIVGTNGSILFSSNSFKLPMKECFVLPSHKFFGWKEFNNDGEWQLKLATPEHKDDTPWFQIASRRWRFIGRQIDGAYPNWRQVVPGESQFTSSVQFDEIDTLADTIDRLPDYDPVNHAIGIEKNDNTVNLLWKPEKDHEWKRLSVTVHQLTGDDIAIFLNRHYLTKALRFGLSRLGCIDPMSPVKFSHEGRQMIVMPVRAESTPTAASQAQETPSQQPAAPSPAANEERTPMVNDTNTNGTSKPAEPITIDAQLGAIIIDAEALRTTVQDTLGEVSVLCKKLKTFQREHKSSTKDLQSVRQTLEKLQNVRL
ncbi:MAG TPA: DNA polymerase III subunit beta [Chthoniobacter sp.]|jgi:DNA polymerase III sliding clamp (beta) subunit (PCNA family)